MGSLVRIEVPPRPEFLALVRMLVAQATATAPEFSDERLDDLRLVVSEACTNAMEAQRDAQPAPGTPISVSCEIDAERVRLEIVDHGAGFDPAGLVAHPPVTDPSRLDHERGLGIPLMRMLADQVEFRPTPTGTTVRLVLAAEPRPPDASSGPAGASGNGSSD